MKQIKNTAKQKQEEKDIKQKLMLFDKLPSQCLTCPKEFDRLNKEQVKTWFVTVKESENKVNLYCPDCWAKALTIIEDFKKRMAEKYDTKNKQ